MTRATVEVRTGYPYEVHVGSDLLPEAAARIAKRTHVVLTDAHVAPLWAKAFGAAPRIVVAPGEASKSLRVLESVLDELVASRMKRDGLVVCLGGGVVGDLGGLAASLYMRGIDFVQCPTTLLAQVDSSVGGKTAINLAGGKNLAGTFHQPIAVYADVATLATLADEEFTSGLGEVVKSALVGDPSLLDELTENAGAIRARRVEALIPVVERCVRVKAAVVAADEREAGTRKTLNLGHTFAHAIEHAAGYGTVPHGLAVSVGLSLAVRASARLGLLADPELPERLARVQTRLGLPSELEHLPALTPAALRAGLTHDKKGQDAGRPRLVLPRAAGDLVLDIPADDALLAELLG